MNPAQPETPSADFAALVGLDWGHGAHAIALQAGGVTAPETSTLAHSAELLHRWLEQLEQRFGGRPVAVVIESSKGAAVYALIERPWITIYPIHPATSSRCRAAFRPSGAKDDTPDALVLLSLLQHTSTACARFNRPRKPRARAAARLVEARRKAEDRRTLLSNQLQSTLRDYFPQALELVGEHLASPLALDFLKKWPRLTDAKAARVATLKSFYHRHNVRRPEIVEGRIQRNRSARPLTRDAAVVETAVRVVRLLVAELRVLQEHVAEFEVAIAQAFAAHPGHSLFRELPGGGPTLAPRLLAVFGTVRDRFGDAGSMQRYFGVAPVTERSGGRVWVH